MINLKGRYFLFDILMWKSGSRFTTKLYPAVDLLLPKRYANNSRFRFASSKTNVWKVQRTKTHYEILDIRRSATSDEIRNAFLKLSKQLHPDINKNPDNHKQFVKINEAYSVLSRPLSRRDYDLSLDAHKYFTQQQNFSAYRSHGYGNTAHSGDFYHHRNYMYEEGSSSNQQQEFNSGKRLHSALVNFYSLTAFLTVAVVAFILQLMHTVYPSVTPKNFIHGGDVDKHELIMTSEHDGRIVFYYAIPNTDDPQKFEILAVAKKDNDKDSQELERLNNVSKIVAVPNQY